MSGSGVAAPRGAGLRIWHLLALTLAVAVGGAMVHEGRLHDPGLALLAMGGFLGWCLFVLWGLGRLKRSFARFDPIGDERTRRGFKAVAVTLYSLGAVSVFGAGVAIFLVM